MVGRSDRVLHTSSLPSKVLPPPPYQATTTPLIVAGSTTTTTEVVTTTTTQTTTHFLSSPLWRKRANPPSSSPHQSTSAVSAVEDGSVSMSSSYRVDKDLPPTPTEAGHSRRWNVTKSRQHPFPSNCTRGARTPITSEVEVLPHPSPPIPHKSFTPTLPSTPTTSALAHAALGLGLPHVMPHVSARPSASDVNTVAFITSPQTQESRRSLTRLQSRSTHRLRNNSTFDKPSEIDKTTFETRRARGLSLGALLNLGYESKGKGKEREPQDSTLPKPSPKPLSRRPSFWSRKKNADTSRPTSQIVIKVEPLSLPDLHPVSPFDIDLHISQSDQNSSVQHARGLSRSHSDRARSLKPSATISNDIIHESATSELRPRRPSTVGSSPAHSFYEVSPSVTFSPQIPSLAQNSSSPSQCLDVPPQPNRPRAQTNPPFLHRLSVNILPSSSNSLATTTPITPNSHNVSPSVGSAVSPGRSFNHTSVEIVKPQGGEESPEVYLNRLVAAVSKAEIATILASSGDDFHVHALRSYIEQFKFLDDPLDVALRKLLMDVALPRETQQIDRVIEAFANRYLQCNPSLFTSDDHPYILAFSLIMLHTDAFNKSNKRKMTKADYIKNTKLPGVASEVLDCFYDNVVFAPFIFIEDPVDVNGQRGLFTERTSTRTLSTVNSPVLSPSRTNVATTVSKGNKVDPYFLISQNMLDPLRVDVENHVPWKTPYSYEGTVGPWNDKELQRAFARANVIEVAAVDSQRSSPLFALSLGGAPSPPMGTLGASGLPDIPSTDGEAWTLKVAKAGLLNRKDDTLEGGKKANNRKWRPWGVILTGSQLLLFRDPALVNNLLAQSETPNSHVIFPETWVFKPEELLSVRDSVAVYDSSYVKHKNTFRFVMPNGRQILLQSSDEKELNEWISRINYASAFKSAGIRMRPLGMSSKDMEMTGVAAATSHLHDTQQPDPKVRAWDGDAPRQLMEMLSGGSSSMSKLSSSNRRFTMMASRDILDLDSPITPKMEGADQFKATFDQVKAELAAGNWLGEPLTSEPLNSHGSINSPDSISSKGSPLPSRSEIIRSKIRELDARISAIQTQLDSHLRLIRNIATLTPFQKSTRHRLETSVHDVARKITQVRLDMAKLICHREVLSNDLVAAGNDWRRAKSMAMKAATQTLQSGEEQNIPTMTFSIHKDDEDNSFMQPALPAREDSPRRESTCDSFHSALDFGPEWPSSRDDIASSFLGASRFEATTRNSSSSSVSLPYFEADASAKYPAVSEVSEGTGHWLEVASSPRNSEECSHEKFYTAQEGPDEQAEEWNKTRAGKRVSLVRLPSGFQMSTLFEKHAQVLPRKAGGS